MTRTSSLVLVATAFIASAGCVTPRMIPWEPPVPWKPDQAVLPPPEPPAAKPQPVSASQFASDVVQPAQATEPQPVPAPSALLGPPLPPALVPMETPGAPVPPTIEPAVVAPPIGLKPAETKEPQDPSFKLRGRIEADSITVTQSPKDKALFGNYQDAVGFRRLRLGSEGTANEVTRWVAEVDFAGGNIALKDAFVAVNHLPFLREVRVGHMAEPFSLEGQTRSVWFPFTERSPAFTFDPTRNWGVGVYSFTDDRNWVIQGGLFKSGTDNTGTDIGDSNDLAGTGRVVWVPWYQESDDSLQMLHIGGAASERNAKDGIISFNRGPQSNLLQSGLDNPRRPFVVSLTIPGNQYQLYNLQSALVLGPLSFEAEWSGTRVEQTGGGPVTLDGWYIQAGYFLTGEHRNYNRDFGTFWEPTVRRPFICKDGSASIGPGAWEVGLRLAHLNFDNANLPRASNGLPLGTRTTTITLGLNWYLNDNARIMVDWVHAIPDYPPFGTSTADLFTVRSAVFW